MAAAAFFRRPEPADSGSVGRKRIALRRSRWSAMCGALQRGWGCGGRGSRLNPFPAQHTVPPERMVSALRSTWRHHPGYYISEGKCFGCISQGKCFRLGWGSAPAATNHAGRHTMSTFSLSSSGSALFPQRILRIRRAVPRLNYKPFAEAKPADLRDATPKGDEP